VRAVVLGVEPQKQKFSLGIKQLTADPWSKVPEKYRPGIEVKGKITNLVPFGVFLELEEGVEGLIHISQLSEEKIEKPESIVKVGDEITAKVIKVHLQKREISLSVKKYLQNIEREQINRYLDQGKESKISLGELLVAALQKKGKIFARFFRHSYSYFLGSLFIYFSSRN
jgi:small subunit ribosomal protein S1